jgi:threonylcarbamoyladenosine tRNA methylthiotransferase MtaB
MTGFSVDFLGCKISHTDADAVREALVEAGHTESSAAAIRVVNTCCITAEAEKKSRQRVRRHASTPGTEQVFVTGCGANLHPDSYADPHGKVTVLAGGATLNLARIVEAANELGSLGCIGSVDPATEQDTARTSRSIHRTRAFVKVQDGCSFTCSYCIVPSVRGESRSRTMEAVLADVARRVARGQVEMVLTGVNIGLYRDPESRASLPTLLKRVAAVEGVHRVRISSIEVNHVSKRLVDAIATTPTVCPHLHVPLQSGDDMVLEGMRRHYRTRRYRDAIRYAREHIPGLNLTTDVIIGYPTEDDASFDRTREFCAEMGFTKIHAFPYSPRPGTRAEEAADPVPKSVKAERSRLLRADADARALRLWKSHVGTDTRIIVELGGSRSGMALTSGHTAVAHQDVRDQRTRTLRAGSDVRDHHGVAGGYTADYCPVTILDASGLADGELVNVYLQDATPDGLVGHVIGR